MAPPSKAEPAENEIQQKNLTNRPTTSWSTSVRSRSHRGQLVTESDRNRDSVTLERQHRDNCLLDRRETLRQQSSFPIGRAHGTSNGLKNYGGMDDPDPARRSNYIPVKFTQGLIRSYCALPYNDKAREGHRPEAAACCSVV